MQVDSSSIFWPMSQEILSYRVVKTKISIYFDFNFTVDAMSIYVCYRFFSSQPPNDLSFQSSKRKTIGRCFHKSYQLKNIFFRLQRRWCRNCKENWIKTHEKANGPLNSHKDHSLLRNLKIFTAGTFFFTWIRRTNAYTLKWKTEETSREIKTLSLISRQVSCRYLFTFCYHWL